MQFHPDKVADEEKPAAEKQFIEITKAYKALTDEVTKRNYEEWGHPDGRQSLSMGIALPTWIVTGENQAFLLTIYGIAFGIILPLIVGRWWYRSKGYTRDKILFHTMNMFFLGLKEHSTAKDLLHILAESSEFSQDTPMKPGDEARVAALEQQFEKSYLGPLYKRYKNVWYFICR